MSILASEVKTYFETLIDDSWDDVATYQLMQNEQEKLELERDWMVLRTLDISITITSVTTWQTQNSLPTDFLAPRKVFVGTVDGEPLTAIDYDQILMYKDLPGYYAIDYVNRKIYFTGTFGQSYTVYLFYQKTIGTINDGTETLPWTGKSGLLIAYRMAAHHKGGVDGDTLNFQMTPEQRQQYREMLNSLIQHDTTLQLKSMGN